MRIIRCATGTPQDLRNAVEDRIMELEGGVVESACNTSGVPAKPEEEVEGEEAIMGGNYSDKIDWSNDEMMSPEMFKARTTRWKYKLPKDMAYRLRSAINEDDSDLTVATLKEAVDWCYSNIPDAEDDTDLNDISDELSLYSPDSDEDEDEIFAEVNYILDMFFDYCDLNRIWIDIEM